MDGVVLYGVCWICTKIQFFHLYDHGDICASNMSHNVTIRMLMSDPMH